MFNAQKRINRGAALLDARKPGWWWQVDLDELLLYHAEFCVLGQVYGDYHDALTWLGISGARHGFNARTPWGYGPLTRRWGRVIEARRSADWAHLAYLQQRMEMVPA